MLPHVRSRGLTTAAGVAVAVSLFLPLAAAQGATGRGTAQSAPAAPSRPVAAAAAMPRWLRAVLRTHPAIPAAHRAGGTTTDFKACPKLPTGYWPSKFNCFVTEITGGKLVMGLASQPINKVITIAYAEGTDPKGHLVTLFGSLKSRWMPSPGGIFLTPATNTFSESDPQLQLFVQPEGLGMTPDTTGNGVGYISMRVRAINPLFGKLCHIGWHGNPVTVDPSFGTTSPPPPNKPIHGRVRSVTVSHGVTTMIGTVVDNAFAAPDAVRCGPDSSLDPVINEVAALPSPAGTNTAIFQVTIQIVSYKQLTSK